MSLRDTESATDEWSIFFRGTFKSQMIFSPLRWANGRVNQDRENRQTTRHGRENEESKLDHVEYLDVQVSDYPGIESENRFGAQVRGEG